MPFRDYSACTCTYPSTRYPITNRRACTFERNNFPFASDALLTHPRAVHICRDRINTPEYTCTSSHCYITIMIIFSRNTIRGRESVFGLRLLCVAFDAIFVRILEEELAKKTRIPESKEETVKRKARRRGERADLRKSGMHNIREPAGSARDTSLAITTKR